MQYVPLFRSGPDPPLDTLQPWSPVRALFSCHHSHAHHEKTNVQAELLTPYAPNLWPQRCWREAGIHEGPRPCTPTASAFRAPLSHSCVACVPSLTVSYGHNHFSVWSHFCTHVGCNQDWKLSRRQMPSFPIVVLFFIPRSLVWDFFLFQGKIQIPIHVI